MTTKTTNQSQTPALSRRGMLIGAGAAGAAAVAATALPRAETAAVAAVADAAPPVAGGGYRVTAHVTRYYQTTKV